MSTGAGTQEFLVFKGSSASDRVRVQTTGAFVVETGVSARLWPTINSNVTPAFVINTSSNVGIQIASPQTTLDVAGTGRFQTLSTLRFHTSSINTPGTILDIGGTVRTQSLSTLAISISSISLVNVPRKNNLTVMVANPDVYTSSDGITWARSYSSSQNMFGIAYDGTSWVITGSAVNSIRRSTDTVNWTNGTNGFTSQGYAVVYGGGIWVAVGTNSPTDSNTIKYSFDGLTWTNASGGFTNAGLGVAFNGSMFIAVGDGGATMKYSYDGKTWTNITNNPIGSFGNAIAWNGFMWVAGGQSGVTSRYSYDGINWLSGTGSFTTAMIGVAWNGFYWVAVGLDSTATKSIKYSGDGINWSDVTSGTFTTQGNSISWNGSVWIAGGSGGAGLKYSGDGLNWSNGTGTVPTTGWNSIYSYGPPAYQQANFQILQDNVPFYYRSTNQILIQPSSMLINNTLQIDETFNRVGINTYTPQYSLDIMGNARISSLIVGTPTTNPSTTSFRLLLTNDSASKPFTTAWTSASDQRVKSNIMEADYDRCYTDVKSLQLRRFTWQDEFFNEADGYDKRVLGFVAQEVSSIVPKAVRISEGYGYSNFHYLNVDQLNMSLYGAVKKTISDKEVMDSTIKGQRIQIETLQGITTTILSTLEGLQGR